MEINKTFIRLFIAICFIACYVIIANGHCVDTEVKCKLATRQKCWKNADLQRRCPRSCKTCIPTDEDKVFEDIINENRYESMEMLLVSTIVIGAVTLGIFKVYTAPAICRSKGTMKGKTVIITGGTSGIGYETVYHLATRGARVIIGCRELKKGLKVAKRLREETKQKFIEVKILNLASIASVREFATDIIEEVDEIDVLINNAAIIPGKTRSVTDDNLEETFQVNYLGHYLLTTLLLDKMKQSAPSRIINVVCDYNKGKLNFNDMQSKKRFNYMQAYYNSKLCLLFFNHELSIQLQGTGVTTYAVNPGLSETSLWRSIFPYSYRITWLFMLPWLYMFCKSPNYGAETTYYCSLDKELDRVSGKYFRGCREIDIGKFHDGKSRKLWETTEQLINYYADRSATSPRKPRVTFDTETNH